MAHGLSCSTACGIFPDQGSNPRPLHWQVDSQPLHHHGSPVQTNLNDQLQVTELSSRVRIQSLALLIPSLVPFLFFFLINLFILFIFIFGCIGSSLLRAGFLYLWRAGATLGCRVRASHCGGFSCCKARALSVRASVVVAHGLSCSAACGIFPDQGSNLCPLCWQAGS